HQLKQNGWTPSPLPDGSTLWRSPSGRQYLSPPQHEPPPPLPADARLQPPRPPELHDTGPPDDDQLDLALHGLLLEDRNADLELPEPAPQPPPAAAPRPNNGWPDPDF
ncbi:MAG: hypothetical protein ACLGIG_11985, partial [Actinomycetes bacterium]